MSIWKVVHLRERMTLIRGRIRRFLQFRGTGQLLTGNQLPANLAVWVLEL